LSVFDSLGADLRDSRSQFESWLDHAGGPYFVMENDGIPVGCGGYSLSDDGSCATLRWGMVDRGAQKNGLGRFLLMFRMREISRHGTVGAVLAHPPAASAGFYAKEGFRVNNGAPLEMIRKLTVCP
jgi:GNAT superfamily N-acetyltransferase